MSKRAKPHVSVTSLEDLGVRLSVVIDLGLPEGNGLGLVEVRQQVDVVVHLLVAGSHDDPLERLDGRESRKVHQQCAQPDPVVDVLVVEGSDHLAELDRVGVAARLAGGQEPAEAKGASGGGTHLVRGPGV